MYKTGTGSLLLSNSRFYRNQGHGAYLTASSAAHTVSGCTFEQNAGAGAHLKDLTGTVSVSSSTFANNTSHGLQVTNSTPAITANTLTGNAGYGLYVQGSALPASVSGNTLSGNAVAQIGMDISGSGTLVGDDNIISGPMFVEGGTIGSDISWASKHTYFVTGTVTVSAGKTLTVAGGLVVKFAQNAGLQAYGTLAVTGAAGAPAVFTDYRDDSVGGDSNGDGAASSPEAGWWPGLEVWGGGSASIDRAEIRYGGGYVGAPANRNLGGLYKEGLGTLTVSNTRFWKNSTQGLYIRSGSAGHTVSGCTFEENVAGGPYLDVGAGAYLEDLTGAVSVSGNRFTGNTSHGLKVTNSPPAIAGNTFTANGGYGLYVTGSVLPSPVSGNALSGNFAGQIGMDPNGSGVLVQDDNLFSGPLIVSEGSMTINRSWASNRTYYLGGGVTVAAGKTLTVPAGRVVKFKNYGRLQVNGTLSVTGGPGNPAIFTDYRDDSAGGDTNEDGSASAPAAAGWVGIGVGSDGSAAIDWGEVRYGGYYYYRAQSGLYKEGAGSLLLTNSRLYRNQGAGLILQSSAALHTVSGCTFEENAGQGADLADLSGTVTVGGNVFIHNTATGLSVKNSVPAITGNTLTGNGSSGLTVQGLSRPTSISGNSMSGNAAAQIRLDPNCCGLLQENNIFVGPVYVEGGTVNNDVSWASTHTYYLVGTVYVSAGKTLTIPAGRVLKFASSGKLQVLGGLTVTGTAGSPVIFTDFRDDSVGGDSNGDGSASGPVAGGWWNVYVQGSAVINWAEIRYGNTGLSAKPTASLTLSNSRFFRNFGAGAEIGSGAISGCTFEENINVGARIPSGAGTVTFTGNTCANNTMHGLQVYSGAATISGNTFTGNVQSGIDLAGSSATTPTIRLNTIRANDVGISCSQNANPVIGGSLADANDLTGNISYGVRNTSSTVTVNARHNWWGDDSGPYHPTTNPGGLGDRVSDSVDYGQYRGVPRSVIAPNIRVAPASKDFGSVLPGETPTQAITVSNNGSADLSIDTLTVTGPDMGEFEIRANLCEHQGLAPGGSCGFEVAYLRVAAGTKSARVDVASNDPDHPSQAIPLQGTGRVCTFVLAPMSFALPAHPEPGSIAVTADSGCVWDASTSGTWITIISGGSGSGSGSVQFSVTANKTPGPQIRDHRHRRRDRRDRAGCAAVDRQLRRHRRRGGLRQPLWAGDARRQVRRRRLAGTGGDHQLPLGLRRRRHTADTGTPTVDHSYTAPGSYLVTLTITAGTASRHGAAAGHGCRPGALRQHGGGTAGGADGGTVQRQARPDQDRRRDLPPLGERRHHFTYLAAAGEDKDLVLEGGWTPDFSQRAYNLPTILEYDLLPATWTTAACSRSTGRPTPRPARSPSTA